MPQQTPKDSCFGPDGAGWIGPSESESHCEHRAALEATVFRSGGQLEELVLELEAGEFRLHRRP